MRKLGEQWIEVIDGQEHMVKCVERHSKFEFYCGGCFFNGHLGECLYHSQDCPIGEVEHGYIKDLGILNDYGMLPCPFCGDYPEFHEVGESGTTCIAHLCKNPFDDDLMMKIESRFFSSLNKAIEYWNYRKEIENESN